MLAIGVAKQQAAAAGTPQLEGDQPSDSEVVSALAAAASSNYSASHADCIS
jgi:hypothetical protein